MAKPVRTRAAVVSRNRLAELTSRPNHTSARFQQSIGRATTIIVEQSAYVHGAGGRAILGLTTPTALPFCAPTSKSRGGYGG